MRKRKPLPPHGFIGKTFIAFGPGPEIVHDVHLDAIQRTPEREQLEQAKVDAVGAALNLVRSDIVRGRKVRRTLDANRDASHTARKDKHPVRVFAKALRAEHAGRELDDEWVIERAADGTGYSIDEVTRILSR